MQSIKEVQELDDVMNRIITREINMSNWNGKIKCIKNDDMFHFTSGKIYEVKNGCIKDDNLYNWSNSWNKGYENLNEFNKRLNNNSIFEEIKENENLTNENCCNSNVLKSDLPNKIPVLCELLKVEPLNKFGIQFNFNNNQISKEKYYIDRTGHLLTEGGLNKDEYVPYLISGEYQILKLQHYHFAEKEITIMSALFLNNYNYIARKENDNLWAYEYIPETNEDLGIYITNGWCCKIKDEYFKKIQFGTILDIKSELSKLN